MSMMMMIMMIVFPRTIRRYLCTHNDQKQDQQQKTCRFCGVSYVFLRVDDDDDDDDENGVVAVFGVVCPHYFVP